MTMADLKMTPARIAAFRKGSPVPLPINVTPAQATRAQELAPVLRAIRAHEVWLEDDGRSVETFAEYFGVSDSIGEVTEEVRLAKAAGLATPRSLQYGGGAIWELTEVGARALADLDASDPTPTT